MAYNATALVTALAKDAYNLLMVENQIAFDEGLYDASGMDDEIYAKVQVNPDQAAYAGLSVGEVYNAVIALQALATLLNANNEQHRQALAKVVSARNSGL